MRYRIVMFSLISLFLLSQEAFAVKVLHGRDFYDYVEVRKNKITAPIGESVHWMFVWNHRRWATVIFDIPSEVGYYGATIKFEPQPFFYKRGDKWSLFIKRKGYIKLTIHNPGVNGTFEYSISCWTLGGKHKDVIPLKVIFIGPQGE